MIPELGFYALAGHATEPRQLLAQIAEAEGLGLGAVFLSTNHNTRHPVITASFATTMHRLSEGRFTLGLGRGIGALFQRYGLPPITNAQLEDFAGLMRRLWRGEAIVDHDGPAGRYPFLQLDPSSDEDIPLGLTAWGPKTCALAGRAFDQIVLHTLFTDETVDRCVRAARTAAEQAGREPAAVKVWSVFATVPGDVARETYLTKVVARLATYLQLPGYGEGIVAANRWDVATLRPSASTRSSPDSDAP